MDKLRVYLRYFGEHQTLFKAAVIVTTVVIAALFFALFWKGGDASEIIMEKPISETETGSLTDSSEPEAAEIYVDISGQIHNPGVYSVEEGARVFEVIEKAGGLTEDASVEQINQAEAVSDGQKIVIPAKGEELLAAEVYDISGKASRGLININTADSQTLQEIPGVGPATAEKIIAYRTENGRFAKIEDIRNVSGIGEKTFEKLKDKITV